jgi:hypothetical protein
LSEAERFLIELEELAKAGIETARKKNADYANSDDPFANFRLSEMVGVPVERGILVRMTDKIRRIANLLDRDPEVADESVDDTLADLANYALILRVWLRWKHKPASDQQSRQQQTLSLVTRSPSEPKSLSSPHSVSGSPYQTTC